MFSLAGKRALVVGVANADSIAWGCAKAFHDQGAELAVTYQNHRAEPHVRPLAESVDASIVAPLDVRAEGQLEAVFDRVRDKWGGLDILLHSIAYCPKDDLHGRVVDCSADGFAIAMDVSVHSFMRMVRLAEPLMANGGTCMTVTFHGAEKVVDNYNIMGVVKAALEAATRYMAVELGEKGIRLHALSPGPLKTRAASGIGHFDDLIADALERTPTQHMASIEDVGAFAAFLASTEAANVTGGIHHIDGGYNVVA